MSWSASLPRPVPHHEAKQAIDQIPFPYDADTLETRAARAQFEVAKRAAKAIVHSIPGPYVMVGMSGHANGIGWQAKEGWSNDMISVAVNQITDEDMDRYYRTPAMTAATGTVESPGTPGTPGTVETQAAPANKEPEKQPV